MKIPVQHNKHAIHHAPIGHSPIYRSHFKAKPLPHGHVNGKRHIKPIRIMNAPHNNRDDLKASASSGKYISYKRSFS